MFSGIVEEVGTVTEGDVTTRSRLGIAAPATAAGASVGDSIAVNGCCLTVASTSPGGVAFDVMPETAGRTTLGRLGAGDRVNLETALAAGEPIGGHLVAGHVDAVGEVVSIHDEDGARRLSVRVPDSLLPLLAPQGSVAVDGISLTVVALGEDLFTVSLVAHTLAATTARDWRASTAVNLEADLVARYVARAVEAREMAAHRA